MVTSSITKPCLFLYLEYKKPQVDVLGRQQFVTFHGVYDGERHVIRLIVLIGKDKVIDHRVDFHIVVGSLEEQEGALHRGVDLAFQNELEGESALAGQVGVALRVIDAGLEHPGLVQHGEPGRLVVEARDEVVCSVGTELNFCNRTKEGGGENTDN